MPARSLTSFSPDRRTGFRIPCSLDEIPSGLRVSVPRRGLRLPRPGPRSRTAPHSVQLLYQPLGRDFAVGGEGEFRDFIPVDWDVEVDAEPAAMADVGRDEEAVRLGGHE